MNERMNERMNQKMKDELIAKKLTATNSQCIVYGRYSRKHITIANRSRDRECSKFWV